MADSALPPSRFGAGYTVGAPAQSPAPPAALPPSASLSGPSAGAPMAGAGTAAPAADVNSLAAASFVLVLLFGPFVVPLTVPLSLRARSQIVRSGEGGAGLVTATLALSCIYLAAAVVVGVLVLVAAPAGVPPH